MSEPIEVITKVDLTGQIPDELRALLGDVVERVAGEMVTDMKQAIQSGDKTGRQYTKRGGQIHQASAEGEAPASDEGQLVNSIGMEMDRTENQATISVSAEHAAPLEFGSERTVGKKNPKKVKTGPRPFITPAAEQARKKLDKAAAAAVRSVGNGR